MAENKRRKFVRYLYWVNEEDFKALTASLKEHKKKVGGVMVTPCEVLKATGNKVSFAAPAIWSRVCTRQGSWYRSSDRAGKYMVVSEEKLPAEFDRFLDAQITESEFVPERLPSTTELQNLVESEEYRAQKPADWESKGLMDAVMFKILFTFNRFWGWGDNLRKHWLSHRANHANFLARHFTHEMDGEAVPYSVADNAGICSSCVEFFNLVEEDSRKLVRACPGSVTFGNAKGKVYYDVKPVGGAAGLGNRGTGAE